MSHPPDDWDDIRDLVGDEFLKLYICFHNKWNPYSNEVKEIPDIYWNIAFNLKLVDDKKIWENMLLPTAEAVGNLTHPEIFEKYIKVKNRKMKTKKVSRGEEVYKEDIDGSYGAAEANSHYDPNLGLVDDQGRIIIPKKDYESMLGLDGVAVSW